MDTTSTVRFEMIAAQVEDLAGVREGIRHLTDGTKVPTDDAVLAVNELATNAVLYAGRCLVRARISGDGRALHVEIFDPLPVPLPVCAPADVSAAGGRGLPIVNQLVTRWGVQADPPTGKTVWFEIEPLA